jgi:hypothetical protein
MDLSDASEKIPSDTTGDRSGDLPTSSAAVLELIHNEHERGREVVWTLREEKNVLPLPGIEPRFLDQICSLVTIPTIVSWLLSAN